ncbi:MAG: helix-turn-helix domain-containing protein [Bacteroidota bacterium]
MQQIDGITFYTTPEVAQKLGVNILTVRRWIESGRLTASRIGRSGPNQSQPNRNLRNITQAEMLHLAGADLSSALFFH